MVRDKVPELVKRHEGRLDIVDPNEEALRTFRWRVGECLGHALGEAKVRKGASNSGS